MKIDNYTLEILSEVDGDNNLYASGYRERIIDAGPVREVEIIPVWKSRSEKKRAKEKLTPEAIERANEKNALRKAARLANANFTREDIAIRLSYKTEPNSPEQAQRDVKNFIKRLSRARQKAHLPPAKYMYSTEWQTKSGEKRKRIHHHIIISGGLDRTDMEKMWGKGYANTQQLQPDEHGIAGKAMYIAKHPHKYRRWCASKNLAKPTVKERPISAAQVAKTAEAVERAREMYEKRFKNHHFVDMEIHHSSVVPGPYIYIRMRRNDNESLHSRPDHWYDRLRRKIFGDGGGSKKNGPPANAHRRPPARV